VTVHRTPDGRAWTDVELGCLYEGAPGQVHGGYCAMLLDQVLGEAAAAGGHAGMTVYLHTTYRRITRLGPITVEAWTDGVDGRKTTVKGYLADASGEPCIEAEALFIMPRSHRQASTEA
jgi:acyl-coenzyme A thioesterase PaaI-like protein